MNTIKVSQDGVMVFWNSHKAPRQAVKDAFKGIGSDDLLPLFDPIDCLKQVCKDIVDQSGLKVRGQPIEARQLRRDVIGVSAVREIKGEKRNQYRGLFSLGCSGTNIDDFQVSIIDIDSAEAPQIAQHHSQLEKAARELWMVHKDWLPAAQLTESLRRLVFRLKGTMLKESGGLYWIADEFRSTWESVIEDIEKSDTDASFTVAHTPLEFNDRLFKCVMAGLEEEILYHTQQMQDEVAALADDKKKMRRNGIERRLKDIADWTDKVEYYEQLMGVAMPKLRQAIEDAKYAIGVHGLASMGATN